VPDEEYDSPVYRGACKKYNVRIIEFKGNFVRNSRGNSYDIVGGIEVRSKALGGGTI
jgi:hypothetical protein